MKKQFKYILNYTAIKIAITSFVLGSLCLLLFKTSGDTGLVGIGYWCTLLAAFVNSIVLLTVLIHSILKYKDFREHLFTLLIVLLNIPITLFYLNIV